MTATESVLAPPGRYVEEIPLDLLHEVDHNRDLGDLDGLATSIARLGVLEPVLVRSRTKELGGYEIVAGARRTAAARLAGLATVPCLIENDRTDEDIELARLVENIQRLDPTPLEEAEAYERIIRHFGWSADEVADAAGRSKSHISKRRSLLVLPDEAKAALGDHRINIQTALGMTALVRDRKRLDAVVDALPDVEASGDDLEDQRQALEARLARELRQQELDRKLAAVREELDEAGETIVDYPRYGQWSSTSFRRVETGEAHEAVAINPETGDVVKVTTQPRPERNRQVPKPPPGADVGFVEQARRKKQAELDRAGEERVKVARAILSQPGRDQVLLDYVLDSVVSSLIDVEHLDLYGSNTPLMRDLLELPDDVTLIEYAARTALTRLRTCAAGIMAEVEGGTSLVGAWNRPKPGDWAPPTGDDEDDEFGPERRYLELLEHHGYELTDEERAAITPAPASE